ncbi:MAG TPA: TIGR03118 family protein [Puia sp.]|nr:TIGR03118 family protein [Puia sp.]
MNKHVFFNKANICLLLIFFTAISIGCRKQNINDKALRDFQQVNLVSNSAAYTPTLTDPTLQNAWGLAWAPSGIAWVNSLSGHVSELYTGEGAIVRAPINIPSPGDTIGGLPTGIVFSGGAGFILPDKAGANFLFVGVDGVVSGWNGAAGNNAFRLADNSATSSYTGLAIATNNGSHFIYAANFRTGKIDVWDTTFTAVKMSFWDPSVPHGFAPFNIQAVGSWLFVMYAKVGADGHDQAGYGLGFVDIFNTDGSFVKRFASRGSLNAPWGVVQTPAGFLQSDDMGDESHDGNDNHGKMNIGDTNQPFILIGNFGDGRINVFSLDGTYFGQLQNHNKKTIVIDGLWALSFAPTTATAIDPMRLYFTAGPDKETNGLFGYLIRQ